VFLMAIAIGVNYSTIIPALALAVGYLFVKREIDKVSLVFGFLSAGLFLSWIFVSRLYPGSGISYYGFHFAKIPEYLPLAAANILNAISLNNALVLILVACLLKILALRLSPEKALADSSRRGAYIIMLIVFSIVWLLLFSANTWVVANEFCFRYFIPVLFAGMILLSFAIKDIVLLLNTRRNQILAGVLIAVLMLFLVHPIVLPRDYPIFKRMNAGIPIDVDGYAGDYWSVWPAVMKDLLIDKKSHGFAYRAVGNRENVINHFSDNRRGRGTLVIGCLKSSVDECHKQISGMIGHVTLDNAELVGKDFRLLKMSR
jgi:hypothetical protein